MLQDLPEVVLERVGGMAFISLNRPQALNALSLAMLRCIYQALLAWRDDAGVWGVAIRGSNKHAPSSDPAHWFGHFCAGGDIRQFHTDALNGSNTLEDFFTEEYRLHYLINTYPKPYIALMDGIVMGGGMGLSQGARLRLVTERSVLAMPETAIGLIPDVGGGYFLNRCPGLVGLYLGLTGAHISPSQALAWGLADAQVASDTLPKLWEQLQQVTGPEALEAWIAMYLGAARAYSTGTSVELDAEWQSVLALDSVCAMAQALEAHNKPEVQALAAPLRRHSPLMLEVTLAHLRAVRGLPLADVLRRDRAAVQHCFFTQHLGRQGSSSETVEGIRAKVIEKNQTARWNPARLEDVTPAMVAPFLRSPWTADQHPLRDLG